MAGRAHLHQRRHARHDFRFPRFGADRQVHAGVVQVLVLIDGGGVNRRLHHVEGQGDHVGRDHGFEQRAQLFVELGEAASQLVVVVDGQVPGVDFGRKGGQRSGQFEHGGV